MLSTVDTSIDVSVAAPFENAPTVTVPSGAAEEPEAEASEAQAARLVTSSAAAARAPNVRRRVGMECYMGCPSL
jgi:hypothetical protein